jgi:predicted ATP-grasp superfamily ATP-dependent carboligase
VSNSNFETIVNGKATGWDGYYQVLDLGPKPAKRSFAELRNAPFDIGRYVMRLQHNSTAAENGFYQFVGHLLLLCLVDIKGRR